MKIIQEAVIKLIVDMAEAAETQAEADAIMKLAPGSVQRIIEPTAIQILSTIKETAFSGGLEERRQKVAGFVERNIDRWSSGLDHLELLINICIESGEIVNTEYRQNPDVNYSALAEVATRLQAKACLIANEILCLLKSGFADGALGRWRALHEVTVILLFLCEHGDEMAEKYIAHEAVDTYKAALQHNCYHLRLNVQPFEQQHLDSLKTRYDSVLKEYGSNFKKEYGWAAVHLGRESMNFSQIEKEVALDHWRPYYKWASQSIHPNLKSLFDLLALSEADEEGLLVGPSNSGLTDPADATAIALCQATIELLCLYESLDITITMQIINLLTDEIGKEFLKGDEKKGPGPVNS